MNYIDFIEAFYIFFMFNIFKTTITFHHPIEILIQDKTNFLNFLKHPIYSSKYENKICMLGKIVSWFLVLWILNKKKLSSKINTKRINYIIFSIFFIGTLLMNINSFIYMIPIFLYEFKII